MNVNVLQSNNPYLSKIEQLNRSKSIKQNNAVATASSSAITKNEVNYFKNLFPANATQIDNYISFNRQGNITTQNVNKGTIFDKNA